MIPSYIFLIFVAILGLCLGSFATALIYRVKHRLPFAWGPDGRPVRSMCPPCGRTLTARELVPVLSWVFQGGRCRCGKTKIPVFYPAVELGTMAATLLIYTICGFTVLSVVLWGGLPFLIAAVLARWIK